MKSLLLVDDLLGSAQVTGIYGCMESGERPELTRSGMGDESGDDHWDHNPGKVPEEDEPEPEDTVTHCRNTRPRERVMTE